MSSPVYSLMFVNCLVMRLQTTWKNMKKYGHELSSGRLRVRKMSLVSCNHGGIVFSQQNIFQITVVSPYTNGPRETIKIML